MYDQLIKQEIEDLKRLEQEKGLMLTEGQRVQIVVAGVRETIKLSSSDIYSLGVPTVCKEMGVEPSRYCYDRRDSSKAQLIARAYQKEDIFLAASRLERLGKDDPYYRKDEHFFLEEKCECGAFCVIEYTFQRGDSGDDEQDFLCPKCNSFLYSDDADSSEIIFIRMEESEPGREQNLKKGRLWMLFFDDHSVKLNEEYV
jgi:hypothetical protein